MNKLQRFESLGDNCEFAFFLRASGYDEGSLFRWTLIKNYHALLGKVRISHQTQKNAYVSD